MVSLEIASHEQIKASSGKSMTPLPAFSDVDPEPRIRSSGFGGIIILLLTV
jgi:hypothetical protein